MQGHEVQMSEAIQGAGESWRQTLRGRDNSQEMDLAGVETKEVGKSDIGLSQLEPGGKGEDTKTGRMWRVRGKEAGQTLLEWEKHIMNAVQRRDAQEAIEDSEVRTIIESKAPGPRVSQQSWQKREAPWKRTSSSRWQNIGRQRALSTDKCCCERKYGREQT